MSMEIIGGWALGAYGKSFLNTAKELIKRKYDDEKEQNEKLQALERRWQDFNWGKSTERYKVHMQEIYGHIRVIGTTEPILIGDIFTDVYILDKPQAFRRFDMMKLHEIQEEPEKLNDGKRERGLRVVVQDRGHRLYILGKPGAGKTTFMKYLVHQTIVADELNKLPVFVTLRDWDARNTDILDFIVKQFGTCNFPDAKPFIEFLLETGKSIVLFDGLDEVPKENEQRDKTVQALHDFSKKYLKTQIVITCRVAASDYSFTEFTYIEMADFSESQVKTYVRNWFRNDLDTAEEFLKELSLAENKGIHDLGRSPLLLSMICLAYEETLSIPKRRVELYEEALDALLKKWDSRRRIKRDKTYEKLSLGRKKQMFARIAVEYFEKGEIFFKKKDVAQKIELFLNNLPPDTQDETPDGEAILETISAQHGILVERAKGVYSFSHLTFQEYYTAKYITDNAISGTLNRLSLHLNDRRWREVFLLTASLLHEASPLFKALQSSAQNLLDKRKELHIVQRWCIEQATTHSTHHTSVLRSLCWFIPLNIARAHTLERSLKRVLNRDHSFTRKMVQDIARALEHSDLLNRSLARAFATDKPRGHDFNSMVLEPTYKRARTLHHDIDRARVIVHARINDRTLILTQAIKLKSLRSLARKMSDDLSRDRNFTRERGLARKIDIVLARAQDKAHFIDRNSTNALDLERALDHALERALELDLGLESEFSKALDITIAPETKKIIQHSLDWYISRHTSSTSASLDFVFFKKGVIKTNIFLLASIFQKLPKKERQQKHLKILKRLLENGDETFTCPSYKASDKVWENFYAKSKNSTESFLELRIEDIKNLDIDIAQSYIAANQLFWDCLQVATVEDREAIEDMILNVPEGWEMPEENGAD